jgi:hypothetical protein
LLWVISELAGIVATPAADLMPLIASKADAGSRGLP